MGQGPWGAAGFVAGFTALGVLSGCALDLQGEGAIDAQAQADAAVSPGTPPADASGSDAASPPPDNTVEASMTGPDTAMGPPTGCSANAAVMDEPKAGTVVFNTTGAVCIRYAGNVAGWGISSGTGRMVTVFGATKVGPLDANGAMGMAVAPGSDGNVVWDVSAGEFPYAALYFY